MNEPHENDRLISLGEVAVLLGAKASATRNLLQQPGAPVPIVFNARFIRYWRSEVLEFIEAHRQPLSAADPEAPAPEPEPELLEGLENPTDTTVETNPVHPDQPPINPAADRNQPTDPEEPLSPPTGSPEPGLAPLMIEQIERPEATRSDTVHAGGPTSRRRNRGEQLRRFLARLLSPLTNLFRRQRARRC